MPFLHFFQLLHPVSQVFLAGYQFPNPHEGADNQDIHLDRPFTSKHGGKHGDAMFREDKRLVPPSSPT